MAAKTVAVFGPDSHFLSLCTSSRASALLSSNRAIRVDAGSIRLKYTKQQWIEMKHSVIKDAKRICYICNRHIPEEEIATVDHVVPSSRNDEADVIANLRCCCEHCNHDKANKKLSEYVHYIKTHREQYEYISNKKLKYLGTFAYYHEAELETGKRNGRSYDKFTCKKKYGRKKRR